MVIIVKIVTIVPVVTILFRFIPLLYYMSRFHTIILVILFPEESSEPRCLWPVVDAGWSATPLCILKSPIGTHRAVHRLLRVVSFSFVGVEEVKTNANFSLIMSQELPVTCSKSVSSFKIPQKKIQQCSGQL